MVAAQQVLVYCETLGSKGYFLVPGANQKV
jgi:hypothetical protein